MKECSIKESWECVNVPLNGQFHFIWIIYYSLNLHTATKLSNNNLIHFKCNNIPIMKTIGFLSQKQNSYANFTSYRNTMQKIFIVIHQVTKII